MGAGAVVVLELVEVDGVGVLDAVAEGAVVDDDVVELDGVGFLVCGVHVRRTWEPAK
jgi:hypothetical protein